MNFSSRNSYLKGLLDGRKTVTIYITNGFQMKGKLVSFDDDVLIFNNGTADVMIYQNVGGCYGFV